MTIDHAVSRYAQDAPVVSLDDGKDLAGVLSRISPSPHVSPTTVSPRPNPRRPNPVSYTHLTLPTILLV